MIHLLFDTDFVRWLGVGDIAVLLALSLYRNLRLWGAVSTPVYLAALGYAVVLSGVAFGLVANVASAFPPTPGAKVFAVFATPAAIWVVAMTVWGYVHERRAAT